MDHEELFARAVWNSVPSDEDVGWVMRVADIGIIRQPLGDYGAIVQDMLDKGVSAESIARFATIVGYETACGICQSLEDPAGSFDDPDVADGIEWGLFRVDPESGRPLEPMPGNAEWLLSRDPRGAEMNPSAQALATFGEKHHDTVVAGNAALRRRWLCDFLGTSSVEAFEVPAASSPVPLNPAWPGRRVGFLLGFADTDVWIMSSGLSDPEHPSTDPDWHRIVGLPAPEILSRVPVGAIDRHTGLVELLGNRYVGAFLTMACAGLRLHADEASRGAAHQFTRIVGLAEGNAPTGWLVHFSDVASLGLADPIPVSDHPRLTVPVRCATVVGDADLAAVEADGAGFSRRLQEDGRLGSMAKH